MVQAEWKSLKWEISDKKLNPIQSIEIETGARTKTDEEKECTVFVGRTIETVRLTYKTSTMTGGRPAKELEEVQKLVKSSAPLYVGTEQIGDNDFMLKSAEITDAMLTTSGVIVSGTIALDFIEDAKPVSESALKIIYKGVDITSKVSVAELYTDQYAEDHADVLEIHFNDAKKTWDAWAKEGMTGKEIRVEYGTIKTGKMFIHSAKPSGAVFILKAMSIPPGAMNPTSKSWEKATLEMIAKEIAGRQGLGFKSYDTKGIVRKYVRQNNTPDFAFLSYRCRLEGTAFLVYDGTLILYDEAKREAATAAKVLSLEGSKTTIAAEDNTARAFAKSVVDNGEFIGTYADSTVPGSAELRQNVNEVLASKVEADGLARGFLRQKNKYRNIATIDCDLFRAVSAGSVMNLSSKKSNTWATKVYVYHIRHNIVKNRSKIWVRKPIAW